jgi:hypothetical protein
MQTQKTQLERITEAYLAMAGKCRYRPGAPNDGLGGIKLTPEELRDPARLQQEAQAYAIRFLDEENSGGLFFLGLSDWRTNRALVYTVEAARLLTGGSPDVAVELLSLAVEEIRRETRAAEA